MMCSTYRQGLDIHASVVAQSDVFVLRTIRRASVREEEDNLAKFMVFGRQMPNRSRPRTRTHLVAMLLVT
jgi:hypothetical protein